MEFAKKYGPLCYMRVGPYPMVLISGSKMIRRMLIDHKALLSDRANFTQLDLYTGGGKGFFKIQSPLYFIYSYLFTSIFILLI